jgi:dTDP-4-dehydrorhamnose reductase
MNEREEISVVDDQKGSPTWAADLASFIMHIVNYQFWNPGLYNFSNEGAITWFEFAIEIKRLLGSSCKLNPIPTSAYPTPAKRPANSLMSKEKINRVFGYIAPDWKDSLSKCMAQLASL